MNNDRYKYRVWSEEKGYETQHSLDIEDVNESTDNNGIALRNHRDAFVFEQCTGLKDKNGKLIYEGNVVKVSPDYGKTWDIGYVKYGSYAAFCVRLDQFNITSPLVNFCKCILGCGGADVYIKIIGNIHENPELLEAK